jgi:SAM-dependent methyltransferase
VLVDFEKSVLTQGGITKSSGASPIERPRSPLRDTVRNVLYGRNRVAEKNVSRLLSLLKASTPTPRILVVGGGAIGSGVEALYEDPAVQLIGFDIYGSATTQFIADGHGVPLRAESVDAVVVQAVLEHVLDPWRVAEEIYRVLKPGGLVYAETPFMQQVHEGPYDFTRFTESGHRHLFNRFDLIEAGAVAGPAVTLLWSIDYFGRGLFRSKKAGSVLKVLFFWVRFLDQVIPEAYAVDGASGVFFLGRKSEGEITPREAVRHYRGAQR